jgi:hypothetical protein
MTESFIAAGKMSDQQIADFRERGIVPPFRLFTACGMAFDGGPDAETSCNSPPVDDERKSAPVDDESDVAAPEVVEDNVLYAVARMNEHARAFNKIFKASAFDREAVDRIHTALERMIQKWRSVQSTLKKERLKSACPMTQTRSAHGPGESITLPVPARH